MAPRRHRDDIRAGSARREGKSDTAEQPLDFRRRHGRAEQPRHPAGPERHRGHRRRRRAHVEDGVDRSAGDGDHERRRLGRRPVRARAIDAALESITGVGGKAERTPHPTHLIWGEPGDFDQHVPRRGPDLAVAPAHHTGERGCPLTVGDDGHPRLELPRRAVEGHERFAGLRFAHDDGATGERREIEGVHRLSEAVQDVIGRVHHVVDGPRPDRREPFDQPCRTRPHRDAPDEHANVSRATFAVLDRHHCARGSCPRRAGDRRRRRRGSQFRRHRHRYATEGGDFAGHAEMRQQVRAVGQHVEQEPRVAHRHDVEQRGAGGCDHVERQDALVLLAEAELARRAEHPVGCEAADLPLLDPGPSRHHGATAGKRIERPSGDVRRSAHDVEQRAAAVVHLVVRELRVGNPLALDHPSDDDWREIGPQSFDPVERRHMGGEEFAHGRRRERMRHEGAQPVVGNVHRENWSRKRTSES